MDPNTLFTELRRHLSPDEILHGEGRGGDLSCDSPPPDFIIRPTCTAKVGPVLATLTQCGTAFAPWGGRTSYSEATFVADRPWVALDTSRLDAIMAIEPTDMFVTVEAGCTWAKLKSALGPLGLKTGFWGPASGRHSTVGGALSQHAVFFGSTRYGTSANGVLGLSVALPDGRIVETGSSGFDGSSPFFRHAGPDLTGPFLGDCGALGVKLRATLQLQPLPAATSYQGWRFASRALFCDAFRQIAAQGLASDVVGAHGAHFELHLAFEGASEAINTEMATMAEHICRAAGGAPAPALLGHMHADPFPALGMLGTGNRRWIPIHAIVPHSRHARAIDTIEAITGEYRDVMQQHRIECASVSLAVGPTGVLIEANLTWGGLPNALADKFLMEAGESQPSGGTPADHAVLTDLRGAIAQRLQLLGAVNLQIGRYYSYRSRLTPGTRDLFDTLRSAGDPAHINNPGILDL